MPTPHLTLRPMTSGDLARARGWLEQPHVARWWSDPIAEQYAEFERTLRGAEPTVLLTALADGEPIGLAQWYQ